MPRPRAALRRARATVLAAVIGGLVIVLAGLAPMPAYAARRAEEAAPLAVTIDSLSPSALAPHRNDTVLVTGTVTNTDDQPWTDVRLYPFASTTPMTTTTEITEAADTEENADVGPRITEAKVEVGDLEPGQSADYTMIVPRADLPRAPGVYWFGVHALGSGPDATPGVADGRARTFLPVMSSQAAPLRAAVLVPLRVHVMHNPDGSVAAVDTWQRLLAPTGRLGRLRSIATAPGGRSLSWLVDPAVLDAVRHLADGNRPRDISPTEETPAGEQSGSPTPSPSPSAKPQAKLDPQTAAAAQVAGSWLDAMLPVLQSSDVLALPYGDVDLPASARHDDAMYDVARTKSIAFFSDLGIAVTQVNAPPHGLVSTDALEMTDSATPMVLSDDALPEDLAWGQTASPAAVDAGLWRIDVSSSEAASGGPAPGDPLADVALRQRILAEAAVRALDAARPPLVVTLPDRWRPSDPVGFVSGLTQPWLQLPGLSATTAGQVAPQVDPATLHYPASAARDELGSGRFSSAEALIRTGRSLERVLTRNDTVAAEVVDEALSTVGYAARGSSTDDAASSRGWIQTQLGEIRVQAPAGVTLSGSSGRFAATVVNGLDQPVTVSIHAISDPGIEIAVPKSVQVAASSRATVLLDAGGAEAGVHNVSLVLVDSDGVRIGGSALVPIRAAQVSKIIWLFLALGGALLFGAIGVRLVRRVRMARR